MEKFKEAEEELEEKIRAIPYPPHVNGCFKGGIDYTIAEVLKLLRECCEKLTGGE